MPEKENPKLKYVNLSATREFTEEYADYRKRMKENYYKIKYYLKGQNQIIEIKQLFNPDEYKNYNPKKRKLYTQIELIELLDKKQDEK